MKKVQIIVLFISLLFCGIASAQIDSLGVIAISPQYPQCPDSAFIQQPYFNIQVTIKNYNANSTFSGGLMLKLQSDSLPEDSIILNSGTVYTIQPNSSVNILIQSPYFFNSINYKVGSNVVVVWPVSTQGGTVVKYNPYLACVLFLPFVGMNEYDRGYLDVIPNPSNKYIDLNIPSDIGLKKVRILKPTGEEVRNYSVDLSKRITVEKLSAGIYFLEVVTSDDHVYNTKFIKN